MQPVDVQQIGTELAIRWDDGAETFIALETLRRHCPCAGCRGERDVMGHLHKGPEQTLTPASFQARRIVRVGGYALQVFWADGHNTGLYSFDYMRSLEHGHKRELMEFMILKRPFFLATFFWAGSVVCGHRSATMIGFTEANFWRLTAAAAFLGIYAHLFGQGTGGASFAMFLLSGIVGVGADVFLFQALPRIGSRLSSLFIQCGSVLFAALIEWMWLGTKITGMQACACATILAAGVADGLVPGKHMEMTRPRLAMQFSSPRWPRWAMRRSGAEPVRRTRSPPPRARILTAEPRRFNGSSAD